MKSFRSRAIGLSASRDRIFPSWNWGISEDIFAPNEDYCLYSSSTETLYCLNRNLWRTDYLFSVEGSNQKTLRTLPSMNMIGHITLEKVSTPELVSSLISWSSLGNTVGMMQTKRPMTTAKLHSSLRGVGLLRKMINLWRNEEHSDIGQYVINWSPLFAIENCLI